jgi:hypothetical protein
MTLDEILAALDQGRTVCWGNPGYIVIRDVASHQPYIKCLATGHVTPLFRHTSSPRLAGKEEDFFTLEQPGEEPPAADPVRRVWLLDLRATCLVDAVDEAGARQAWEDGLEYEYEGDAEGGILRIEPLHGREPRTEGAPGELMLSLSADELKILRYCMDFTGGVKDWMIPGVDPAAAESLDSKIPDL